MNDSFPLSKITNAIREGRADTLHRLLIKCTASEALKWNFLSTQFIDEVHKRSYYPHIMQLFIYLLLPFSA